MKSANASFKTSTEKANPSLWLAVVPVILYDHDDRPTPLSKPQCQAYAFREDVGFLPTFAYPDCTCMSNLSIHFKENLELSYLENIDLRNH